MALYNKLCVLFCFKILIGLFGTVAANRTIIDNMSPEERTFFFGTTDGTVPEYQLINIAVPSRTKRSSQFAFTMHVDFGGTILDTTLDIVKDEYLISKSTAIWETRSDPNVFQSVTYYPNSTVLASIGDFYFYQDVDKGSALTNFKHSKLGFVFTGIICQYYAIKAVPMHLTSGVNIPDMVHGHAVKMRSVRSVDEEETKTGEANGSNGVVHVIFRIPQDMQESFRLHNYPSGLKDLETVHSRKRRQSSGLNTLPNVVYPKIVVNLDYDSLSGNSTEEIVTYFISYWNSVDMMYRQLSNPAVRLNIVGIIVPKDQTATAYIASDKTNMFPLDVAYVVGAMGRDFYSNSQRIAVDSYNIVMAMTRKPLCQYDQGQCKPLAGYAMISSACAKTQWRYGKPTAIGGVGIARFDWIFGGVGVMAHELGHVLGVAKHDGEGTAQICSANGGYTMAPSTNFAKNLRWTECSKAAFRDYLSSPAASCLQNRPVVIKSTLQQTPGAWLSINGQCANLLRNSQSACNLTNVPDICNRYGCMVNGFCQDTTYGPVDGTSCGENKHCQNSQCSYIP